MSQVGRMIDQWAEREDPMPAQYERKHSKWRCPFCGEFFETDDIHLDAEMLEETHYFISPKCRESKMRSDTLEREMGERERRMYVCQKCIPASNWYGYSTFMSHQNSHSAEQAKDKMIECPCGCGRKDNS